MTFARLKSTIKMGFINSIFFFIFFYQSILLLPIAASKDILYPGDEVNSLDSTSNLVSADGKLTLGFSTIPSTNLTYLGIWNTNIENDYLWVANRDTPISGDGKLAIHDSGTLKVVYGGGTSIFTVSNGQIGSGNNTAAVLRDTGNFVVYDASDNNLTIWQSFDHPFDTLIPGMKIGYNLTTKQNWTITSRLTDQILASGAFTMRLEQYNNSPQLLIDRRGDLYWASGPWNKAIGTFHFLDAGFTGLPSQYPYNLISDASAMYLIVQDVENSDSTLPLLVLSPNGSFSDSHQETPDFCYGYLSDTSVMDIRGVSLPPRGCKVSAILPHCRAHSDSNIYFYRFVTGFSISGPKKHDDNSSINLSDCKERCWNDCKCTGCSTYTNGTGCITWTGTLSKDDNESDEVFSLKDDDESDEVETPNKKKGILVFMAVLLISALTTFLCYARIPSCLPKAKEKRIRDDFIHQLTGSNSFNFGDELEKGIKEAPDIKIFSLKAILSATKNFSNENKLGEGGYGPVYKGKLFDGREIAVKRLSKTSEQGLEEFKSEMILISKLQHTNLVRLYGCCIHQEEKMLIYEFMPNKSLDFFLFDEDEKEKIDWELRFNIIEGVAHGLLYLHKYSRMKVIHRDLKVSNVLLDVNMNPKIADFGMARIFNQDVAEAMTDRVVGTYGYMAPEYAMEGSFSIKSDVFSFGVLILEIVSGKRNSSFYNLDRPLNLVGYTWELWKGQAALELKDKALGESCDVKQLLRVIHVGLLCVQENANDRPTMSKVISMLNKEIADLPRPKQPAFFTGRQIVEVRSSGIRSTENGSVSNNGLTVTTMEAR